MILLLRYSSLIYSEDLQNHRRQYGYYNDELFNVVEFKQPESMLSTEQYDESTKSNGVHSLSCCNTLYAKRECTFH